MGRRQGTRQAAGVQHRRRPDENSQAGYASAGETLLRERAALLAICSSDRHGLSFGVIRSRPLMSAEGRQAGVDQVASGGYHRTRRKDVEVRRTPHAPQHLS